MNNKTLSLATQVIHAGEQRVYADNAMFPPLVTSSSFFKRRLDDVPDFAYGRVGNPTRHSYESCIAELEGGVGAVACASGMAATALVLELLPKDSHVIVVSGAYGGTVRILEQYRSKTSGFTVSHLDLNDIEALADGIRANTALIWIETPTNPLLTLVDLRKVLAYGRSRGILTCVDNTFATPWNQQPIALGADLVMHSASKYIGGHSDLIGGVVVASTQALCQQLRVTSMAIGNVQGPFDCYLALRGLKTLDVRMERQCRNALSVATWLEQHPQIAAVHYPGLKSHPQHALCTEQMRTGGAVVTIRLREESADLNRFIEHLSIFLLADSLGGVESMINHSYSMSHGSLSAHMKATAGICSHLFRLSIGIESAEDLIADLSAALAAIR
ncbi:trans-sulfuration enzyme family protein [Pseudomonas guariconensis]|uniref:trans-sulfuration enzyme family protein n=1 Tax=Pseudomonas guariconensis TaxID=1288410 RepID=UPI0018A9F93F|nr:PLP-dependent aspartate aminotransferase family protein [Pseudomonas guariconensis]MBF8741905.1 PLP-dependent transferase [Pseudomonas guariconensis]MBF8750879.1 PLP-dependent transferase [Pseudomonas guariconensis]